MNNLTYAFSVARSGGVAAEEYKEQIPGESETLRTSVAATAAHLTITLNTYNLTGCSRVSKQPPQHRGSFTKSKLTSVAYFKFTDSERP